MFCFSVLQRCVAITLRRTWWEVQVQMFALQHTAVLSYKRRLMTQSDRSVFFINHPNKSSCIHKGCGVLCCISFTQRGRNVFGICFTQNSKHMDLFRRMCLIQCTTITWFPYYKKHQTLKWQVSLHIGRRKLKLVVQVPKWHGFFL